MRIEVVAAVIVRSGKVFATQRGYGEWKDWWEFPGGKIEAGESREEALRRELREELDIEVEVGSLIATVDYAYPSFDLKMHCFFCTLLSSSISLLEHEAACWVSPGEFDSLRWLPADEEILDAVRSVHNLK